MKKQYIIPQTETTPVEAINSVMITSIDPATDPHGGNGLPRKGGPIG